MESFYGFSTLNPEEPYFIRMNGFFETVKKEAGYRKAGYNPLILLVKKGVQ